MYASYGLFAEIIAINYGSRKGLANSTMSIIITSRTRTTTVISALKQPRNTFEVKFGANYIFSDCSNTKTVAVTYARTFILLYTL